MLGYFSENDGAGAPRPLARMVSGFKTTAMEAYLAARLRHCPLRSEGEGGDGDTEFGSPMPGAGLHREERP